jgi:hypothetical protein
MNCYIHILPGRIRVRTDFLKKNEIGAFAIRSGLYSLQGIQSVVLNTITGSILISFDVLQISSQDILAEIAHHKAIPLIDCKEANTSKAIRIHVASRNLELNIWPFVFKKAAQTLLGSLDLKPGVFVILSNILLSSFFETI